MTREMFTYLWLIGLSFALGWWCARVKTAVESPYKQKRTEDA